MQANKTDISEPISDISVDSLNECVLTAEVLSGL